MRVQYRRQANIARISWHLCLSPPPKKTAHLERNGSTLDTSFLQTKKCDFISLMFFRRKTRINQGAEAAALNTLLSDQQKPQRPSQLAGENTMSSLTTFILPNPAKEIKVSPLRKTYANKALFFVPLCK